MTSSSAGMVGGAAVLLALALAAWFWLPALGESSLAQLGPVTEGYFHYSNHFRDADLVQRSLLFDYDPAGGRVFSVITSYSIHYTKLYDFCCSPS